ncbi:hypothetical protein [Legionella rowbothamii]|uniref:hypothetical protein n=1 Tax=Legionella rowbothamii TaxID=96229 RepID=UPI00105653ED|nr:hypothetical protein [Legionella rowbothamii]
MLFLGLGRHNALRRTFISFSALLALVVNQTAAARSGHFFNVSATGPASQVSITLCLNGKGPLSCQNYVVSALNLRISTTIFNHVYPAAGIKINTPGYSLSGCTPYNNGYCLFSVSNTLPINIMLTNTVNQTTLISNNPSLALSVKCSTGASGCVYVNEALTGQSRQITVTNNGLMTATNVSVTSSGLPFGTAITSSTCSGTLEPASSCSITVTPGTTASSACTTGTVPADAIITIRGSNTNESNVKIAVLSYGCIYQGGYVYAIDDTTISSGSIGGKVTALSDQVSPTTGILWSADSSGNYDDGVSIWGIDEESTTNAPSPNASSSPPAALYPGQSNCNGKVDGSCNSNNIYIYYSNFATSIPPLSSYAAGRCKQVINGYSDWYLPPICDMGPDSGAMICPSPALQNMVDNLPILIDNCIGSKCLVGDHWSSTEQAGNPSDNAWSECFASGGNSEQCIDIKSELLGVRCSRTLTF